jgi:hypothetical protein
MRAYLVIAVSAGLLMGCGATAVRQTNAQIDFAISDEVMALVGEPQIIAKRVNPRRSATTSVEGAQRVALADGGHVMLWTEGTMEWGRRAMARSFGVDGNPRSQSLVLSSPEMDVFGAPSGASTDGDRVVATFCASRGELFELVAVPIERL